MKKTKIVCTLGPASCTKEVISAMFDAGMNVCRLNFSHGTHEEHAAKIAIIKEIRRERDIPLPVLLDTKGPEFRTGTYREGKVLLKKGEEFTFTTDPIVGDESRVSVNYGNMPSVMEEGDTVLLNNGLISFRVKRVEGNDVVTEVLEGGVTSDRKSLFFPGKKLDLEYLSEQDKKDLLFGIEQGVDFVALSFVSCADDIRTVREFMKEHGGEDIDLIAKIESKRGVDNLEEIVKASDGVMVARGDLGVELPYEELPNTQKHIIDVCRILGKRVITATEMLESMIHSPRPTRAEISDVANAVYDGTSSVMLSGETAAGEYPVEAVRAMAKIAEQAEQNTEYIQQIDNDRFVISTTSEALSHSACMLAHDLGAKAIVVCTNTGMTARMVSRFRPEVPIIGMTSNEKAFRKLALSWGVIPARSDVYTSVDILFYFAAQAAKANGLKKGDTVVMTGGTPTGKGGNSSLINVAVL
ncbi:MAG: pyruvate kinase [Candidatus Borkfalkiaceae bacterium]|nr:pyruvate kinase [Christensenellaceae bacterium]